MKVNKTRSEQVSSLLILNSIQPFAMVFTGSIMLLWT